MVADRHFPCSHTVIKIFPKHVFFSSISRHNPHQGKAHFKFFKPKGPSVYNLSSALIITKLTWHKQPPILAGAALWEVIVALWEPLSATGPVRRGLHEWVQAHKLKTQPTFSFLRMHGGFRYVYIYSFTGSLAHGMFLQRKKTTHTSGRQDEKKSYKAKGKGLRFPLFAPKVQMLLSWVKMKQNI